MEQAELTFSASPNSEVLLECGGVTNVTVTCSSVASLYEQLHS
jgi:hypothetical protein